MFKKRHDYVMEMDVEVDYALMEARLADLSLTPTRLREEVLASLMRLVGAAGEDAVRKTRQKWKGDNVELDLEWPRFSVAFQGDTEGAFSAYQQWVGRVELAPATSRILTSSLRGSDGTNLQYMDEDVQREVEEGLAALPPDALAKIDELMDPER